MMSLPPSLFKPELVTLGQLHGLWAHHPRYRGCILHWLGYEAAGSLIRDISGNRRDGTISGALWALGDMGRELQFDGTDDFVENTAISWAANETKSVSFWIRTTATNETPVYQGTPSAIYLWINLSGGIESYMNDDQAVFGGVVTDDEWHHCCYCYDGANEFFYLDGQRLGGANTEAAPASSAEFWAGKSDFGGEEYSGSLTDLRVYDRELTPEEVLSLYNNPHEEFAWAYEQIATVLAASAGGAPIEGSLSLARSLGDAYQEVSVAESALLLPASRGLAMSAQENALVSLALGSSRGLVLLGEHETDAGITLSATRGIALAGGQAVEAAFLLALQRGIISDAQRALFGSVVFPRTMTSGLGADANAEAALLASRTAGIALASLTDVSAALALARFLGVTAVSGVIVAGFVTPDNRILFVPIEDRTLIEGIEDRTLDA